MNMIIVYGDRLENYPESTNYERTRSFSNKPDASGSHPPIYNLRK